MALFSATQNPLSSKTSDNARQPIKSRPTNKKKNRGHRRSAFRIYSSSTKPSSSSSSSDNSTTCRDDFSTCSTSDSTARQPEVQPLSPDTFATCTWAGANFKLPVSPTPLPDKSWEKESGVSWQPTCFPTAPHENAPNGSGSAATTSLSCRVSLGMVRKPPAVTHSLEGQLRQLTL